MSASLGTFLALMTTAACVSAVVAVAATARFMQLQSQREGNTISDEETEDKPTEAMASSEGVPLSQGVEEMLALPRYFNLSAYSFKHARLLTGCEANVVRALDRIEQYLKTWLAETKSKYQTIEGFVSAKRAADCRARVVGDIDAGLSGNAAADVLIGSHSLIVAERARVFGGVFDLTKGSVFIGSNTLVEPGAVVKGPAIFGNNCEIRAGAYVRGNVVAGDGVVLRGEVKNSIVMDHAEICHTCYVGDSILGYKAHLGAHAVTANLPLLGKPIQLPCSVARAKLGAILGDHAQLGASTVTSPATFLAQNTHVYPLSHVRSGFYGPNAILKPDAAAPAVRQFPLRSV